MSALDNLRTVRRIGEAVSESDLPSILSLCTDDIEILPASSQKVPWARPWRGRKEAEQYFQKIAEALEFQEYAMDEFIAGDNSVVLLGHERCLVRATGRVVEAKWVQIFDFRDAGLPSSRIHGYGRLGRWIYELIYRTSPNLDAHRPASANRWREISLMRAAPYRARRVR